MDNIDPDMRDPVYDESSGATVPTPISSFTHVGRKTPTESLVPSQPFWRFGNHKIRHRSTFR
ncbi:MAG: hypothetical protein QOI70_530 [Microbacteriaceae bacterium]|jgi:hypothetical protein|nr:hypothetical protein [Microbacteriaceae bacterium]